MSDVTDPRLGIGGNAPPQTDEERWAAVDPENLVVIDPSELSGLLALHYPLLVQRAEEMKQQCLDWQADHKAAVGWIPIKDDVENAEVAELMKELDKFTQEVEEARKRVKLKVFQAGQQIDGFFSRGMVDPVTEVRGVTVSGNKPGPNTMQGAMTAYGKAKLERERLEREAAAKAAEAEARRRAEEARKLADEERARIAALRSQGASRQEAAELAQAETDNAAAEAEAAEIEAAQASAYANESASAMVRQHTAAGVSIGMTGKWTFEPTDMVELCLAIGAAALNRPDFIQRVSAASLIGHAGAKAVLEAAFKVLTQSGQVPVTFVDVNKRVIDASITSKSSPMRQCAGLRIYQDFSARRK